MMNIDKRSAVLLASGFLLLILGAMPLNGYIFFFIFPQDFHHDAFIGGVFHLLLGLIPYLAGITLVVLGTNKIWPIVKIILGSIVMGTLIALPSLIHSKDPVSYLGFLAIVATGAVICVATRSLIVF